MIARPTTDQIILDCRRELLETIRPAVHDPAAVVVIDMLESVLRNVATRAAHEVQWMEEEAAAMDAFSASLLATQPNTPELAAALAATEDGESLHLDDVVRRYDRSGRAFALAMEAALASGDAAMTAEAVTLLGARTAREQEIKGEWSMVGRG